jgi:hypothetical protein
MRDAPTPQERSAIAERRRAWLEDWIERAIALLDEIDGDADCEPELEAEAA